MNKRLRLLTVLTAFSLVAFAACLSYPDKQPNPADVEDVVEPVDVNDVIDVTDVEDVEDVEDAADVSRDTLADASDASDVSDAGDTSDGEVVELCIDGDFCDDGNPCTVNDECDEIGQCVGTLVAACDDGIECTDDSCVSEVDCPHEIKAGYCLVGGVCYAADAIDVSVFGQCRICKPDVANDEMTNDDTLTCSDGLNCTENDACSGGACVGSLRSCDDTNVCTDDSCDEVAGCQNVNNSYTVTAAHCEGMMHYDAAVCSGGVQPTVTPENCDDGNDCTTDTCKAAGCNHVARNGQVCAQGDCVMGTYYRPATCIDDFCPPQETEFCDDGQVCTEDYCSPQGGCLTRNDDTVVCAAAACDGLLFKAEVKCSGGLCPVQTPKNCADTNVCTTDSCVLPGGCSNTGNQDPCSDGNACTVGDACLSKTCRSGNVKTCEDNLDCTADSCDSVSGECVFINLGYCIIDNLCYMDNDLNPSNSCQKCSVGLNTDDWSAGQENSTCDVYADGTAKCQSGVCTYNCNEYMGDCDGNLETGCESNLLNDPDYCGDCETDCGTQVCSWGYCADTCAGDLELCAGRCEDVTTSVDHCGYCNHSCARDNAVMTCTTGNCVLTGCDPGYYNVDLVADNGCECHSSGIERCDGVDNDCNGATDDVAIEMMLGDPTNCGQCGRICYGSADHWQRGMCSSGSCNQVPCDPNNFDLNMLPMDGCEYFCLYAGQETCGNSADDNCDGSTDEGC